MEDKKFLKEDLYVGIIYSVSKETVKNNKVQRKATFETFGVFVKEDNKYINALTGEDILTITELNKNENALGYSAEFIAEKRVKPLSNYYNPKKEYFTVRELQGLVNAFNKIAERSNVVLTKEYELVKE